MPSPLLVSVLVVGDDPDAVATTVLLLSGHGFRATGAQGGREAIEAAASDPPDVALIDLSMPGVDGFEVVRRLRAMDAPPVLVAVTGLGSEYDRQRAGEAGFTCYLVKPVPPQELVAELRVLGGHAGAKCPPSTREPGRACLRRPVSAMKIRQFLNWTRRVRSRLTRGVVTTRCHW